MDTLLVDGRYTTAEAEMLLSKLLKVKIDFHIARIDTANSSEENIKHSEKRIKELEKEHRRISQLLKSGSYQYVALRANLRLEFCPDYQNA
jgi:Tfp pilus assembly protein PilN